MSYTDNDYINLEYYGGFENMPHISISESDKSQVDNIFINSSFAGKILESEQPTPTEVILYENESLEFWGDSISKMAKDYSMSYDELEVEENAHYQLTIDETTYDADLIEFTMGLNRMIANSDAQTTGLKIKVSGDYDEEEEVNFIEFYLENIEPLPTDDNHYVKIVKVDAPPTHIYNQTKGFFDGEVYGQTQLNLNTSKSYTIDIDDDTYTVSFDRVETQEIEGGTLSMNVYVDTDETISLYEMDQEYDGDWFLIALTDTSINDEHHIVIDEAE